MQNDLISRSALLEMFDEFLDTAHLQVATRRTGKTLWSGVYAGINRCRNTIAETPAVDAVEVVRCKDCKHRHVQFGSLYCAKDYRAVTKRNEEDFCSYGDRRTEDGK